MSDPPPPPRVSPDGKFYWDGQRWVPMQQPAPLPGPIATVKKSSGRRNGCIGVALLVALVGVIAFCGSNRPSTSSPGITSQGVQSSPSPSGQSQQAVNHTVLAFNGTGYETTQPFKIPTSQWTLSWTITGDPKYADVTFYIYSSSGRSVDSVSAKPGSDSAAEHKGNDVFFIKVLVANAKYSATITANYPGPDQIFSVPALANVATYTGSGDKSTPTFHVTGSFWAISVHSAEVSQYTSLTAYVMGAADNGNVSEASVEGAQGGSDTVSYVYAGPGDYYIKVLVANTDWTITVEQSSS